nr:hypothetical protein CFP56_68253 [Quercus suber]
MCDFSCVQFCLSRQHYETEEFVNRVDEALVILKEQKVLVREFKLRMKVRDTIDASCIDNWMQLLMKNHIKKLGLGIEGQENIKSYTLPRTIFGAEALTVLKLRGCKLVDSLFRDNNEMFTVLRELSIEEMDVYPSEWKRVQKLLSYCPSLEALTVDMSPRSYIGRCKSSFQLVNVPKLKKAYLRNVQKIRIEAPALRTLYCEGWIRAKLDLNLIACNNVKELEIKGFRLTKKFFQDLNSKFPLLEDFSSVVRLQRH